MESQRDGIVTPRSTSAQRLQTEGIARSYWCLEPGAGPSRLQGTLLHPVPPSLEPERQQDRADDHHAFHSDPQPGDFARQFGTRRFSSAPFR